MYLSWHANCQIAIKDTTGGFIFFSQFFYFCQKWYTLSFFSRNKNNNNKNNNNCNIFDDSDCPTLIINYQVVELRAEGGWRIGEGSAGFGAEIQAETPQRVARCSLCAFINFSEAPGQSRPDQARAGRVWCWPKQTEPKDRQTDRVRQKKWSSLPPTRPRTKKCEIWRQQAKVIIGQEPANKREGHHRKAEWGRPGSDRRWLARRNPSQGINRPGWPQWCARA